jgi:hypothetical protein
LIAELEKGGELNENLKQYHTRKKVNLTNEIVYQQLLLIERNGNKGLHIDKIFSAKGSKDNAAILIDYLLRNDLVEFGEEDEYFYLTDVGYDAIEFGEWYDYELEPEELPIRRTLSYSSTSDPEIREKKEPKPISYRTSALIVSGLVGVGSYFFAKNSNSNQYLDLPLDEIYITLDSIETAKQNKPVFIIEEDKETEGQNKN